MIRILHILNSTKRDINIINLYQSIDKLDNYFLLSKEGVKKKNNKDDLKLLKSNEKVFLYDNLNSIDIKSDDFGYLFVYGINKSLVNLTFKYLKKNTKLVWISLGKDIYNLSFLSYKDLYQINTYKVLKKNGLLNTGFKNAIYKLLRPYNKTTAFFKRINFVSPRLYAEMEIIKNNNSINAKYVRLPLGDNTENHFNNIEPINPNAQDIYIGPSAASTSNHIDVFYKLHDLGFEHNIHVTLSYKVNRKYLREVLEVGENLFGNRFKPQTEFYTKEKFNKILNTCNVAIFNNNRQEGLLTVAICVNKGMKVFMSDLNPSFTYLNQTGYEIYSFQKDYNKIQKSDINLLKLGAINEDSIFSFDEMKAIYTALDIMKYN